MRGFGPGIHKVQKNISLRPVDALALEYLKAKAKLDETAPLVRRLIDQEMRREIGRDWEDVLQAQQQEAQEGAVA